MLDAVVIHVHTLFTCLSRSSPTLIGQSSPGCARVSIHITVTSGTPGRITGLHVDTNMKLMFSCK